MKAEKAMSSRNNERQSSTNRNKRVVYRAIIYLISWLVISVAIVIGSIYIDDITAVKYTYSHVHPFEWLITLSIAVSVILFNLASADILRHYVKHHERNVVSWTTAIILFSPFLIGILYLLTWPKDKKLTGLN